MLLDIAIIVFLMVAAILLILAEIFLLPGITLAGIGGAIFAIGGVVFAYTVGIWVGHLTLSLSIITFGIIFAWLLRSRSFNKIALKTDIDSKLTSSRDLGIEPGDEGITLSRLAPIGKARIKGINVEAKSQDEVIDENKPLVVIRVYSYTVILRPQQTPASTGLALPILYPLLGRQAVAIARILCTHGRNLYTVFECKAVYGYRRKKFVKH